MSRLDRSASKGAGSLAVFAALVLAGCVSKACPDGQSLTNGKCTGNKAAHSSAKRDAGPNTHSDSGGIELRDAATNDAEPDMGDGGAADACADMQSVACWEDADHDGFAASGAASMRTMCGADCATGWTSREPAGDDIDCEDSDANAHPLHCWPDPDMDGYAADAHADSVFCAKRCGAGWTATEPTGHAIDCDGISKASNPDASEVCNGRDDDCDGKVDEDADTTCQLENASGRCVNASCALDKCNPGFGTCDRNDFNGCEQVLNVDRNCGACGAVCDRMATCASTKVKNLGQCTCQAPSFGDGSACQGLGPIAVGTDLTCVLDKENHASCFGLQTSPVAMQLPKATEYRQLSISQNSLGCGITLDGQLECWNGANVVPGKTRFLQVVSGYETLCALTDAHTTICWPFGAGAQYGEASAPDDHFVQLAEGWYHVCGLRADGTVRCWGAGSAARPTHCVAGGGGTGALVDCGQSQPPPDKFMQITAGMLHTCGLKEDGSVLCWGVGANSGDGQDVNDFGQSKPPADQMTWISAGALHTCGVRKQGGTAVCWGAGKQGGQTAQVDKLQSDPPGDSFLVLAASEYHTCGLTNDEHLVCWGSNSEGQAPPTSSGTYPLDPY